MFTDDVQGARFGTGFGIGMTLKANIINTSLFIIIFY
jgi:hypothetical protein